MAGPRAGQLESTGYLGKKESAFRRRGSQGHRVGKEDTQTKLSALWFC